MIRKLILLILLLTLAAGAQAIERRKPQFLTETGYLFVPFPYSLPGIGEGFAITALGSNVFDSNLDLFALIITGDAEGQLFGLEDIHIISETLILDLFSQNITKALVNIYESRGMFSDPDDYNLVEVSSVVSNSAVLTLSLFDRKLEFFAGMDTQSVEVPRVRDPDGVLIAELDPPFTSSSRSTTYGALVDYTDDRQDPRKGVRLNISRSRTPPGDADSADFFVWNYALTGYVPIGDISTLALHYFQSDAQVTKQGNTDTTAIAAELGFDCAPGDAACLETESEIISNTVNERRYGTSNGLGGSERLRSYPGSRFQAAHTVFYSAELRLNLSEETTPFDYFIWKDVRTGVQIALFAETGSVGETKGEVGEKYANTYGVGGRLVSGSGRVYRADIATGTEGTEFVVIFEYPF